MKYGACTTSLLAECRVRLLFGISSFNFGVSHPRGVYYYGSVPRCLSSINVLCWSSSPFDLSPSFQRLRLFPNRPPLQSSRVINYQIEDRARLAICSVYSRRALLSGKRADCNGDWVSSLSYIAKPNNTGRRLPL